MLVLGIELGSSEERVVSALKMSHLFSPNINQFSVCVCVVYIFVLQSACEDWRTAFRSPFSPLPRDHRTTGLPLSPILSHCQAQRERHYLQSHCVDPESTGLFPSRLGAS